jgi:ribose transport system substrate-binding protein
VDRRQFNPAIEDLYVAGDTSGFGKVSGESMTSQMPDGGAIVVLRGILTAIELTAVGLTSTTILTTRSKRQPIPSWPDSPYRPRHP